MSLYTLVISTIIFLHLSNTPLIAQNINIPDANFKASLVGNSMINTNGDVDIQLSEAQAYTGSISVSYNNISDLTGIEAFINIKELYCHDNQLTSLNLSNNTALEQLDCSNNQIGTLDLTSNNALKRLDCYDNQLTALNISNNTSVEVIYAYRNQLVNLNVTNCTALDGLFCNANQLTNLNCNSNTALKFLDCSSNQLSSLTVKNGNNSNVSSFIASNNPNLTCIEVDDSTYSANNWTSIDSTAVFGTNCSLINSTTNIQLADVVIYPNPTTDNIQVNLGKTYQEAHIKIIDGTGQICLDKTFHQTHTVPISLENYSGIYFIRIQTESGQTTLKVLKA